MQRTENHGHDKSNDGGKRYSNRREPQIRDGIEAGRTKIIRPGLKCAKCVESFSHPKSDTIFVLASNCYFNSEVFNFFRAKVQNRTTIKAMI